MKFKVDERFFEKVENGVFGIVVAKGIDNSKKYPEIERLLKDAVAGVKAEWLDKNVREQFNINLYREAFRKLDINPNKYMCSIEALAKRVAKGNDIPVINPLVDLGNAMSLKYFIPLGAHNIDKMEGDIEIRYSTDEDEFIPFGETVPEKISKEEVVYASGTDVKTRMWIHRQGENGKITENATNIFFPIDGFVENKQDVIALRDQLAALVKEVFGLSQVVVGFVDKDNREFEF
ncbi:MAG: phenylalanine--tRNA ligase beta subunit-related protein [Anaerovoracaceae bacterium]